MYNTGLSFIVLYNLSCYCMFQFLERHLSYRTRYVYLYISLNSNLRHFVMSTLSYFLFALNNLSAQCNNLFSFPPSPRQPIYRTRYFKPYAYGHSSVPTSKSARYSRLTFTILTKAHGNTNDKIRRAAE